MLTREEDIDAYALHRRGWTISAIARHLGRDRKTIRAYLNNERVAGVRKPAADDPLEPFVDYVRARLAEGPHLLVGTLIHSGRWRGYLAPAEQQPRLIAGLDSVARQLGGLTRTWRFDRMSTVCHPDTGKVTASFAAVAKHYGVSVAICPPRRGNRKGGVEKSNHTAAQRWWRTLADEVTVEEAQAGLDSFCQLRGDTRMRPAGPGGKASVLTLAEREPLAAVPATPFPATITAERIVSAQALVA